jgi:methylenetetrahydrofolate dehydrogenase (NADP+)/methenyltetrahydrofolate cyclohydrolase
MNKIIDGKKIAQRLKDTLKIEIENIKDKFKLVPGLAVIQVGNVAASSVYVKAKTKAAKEVGIRVFDYHLENNTSQKELLELIDKLNKNSDVDGILVQLPLPKAFNEQEVLDSISSAKDADGFHPINVGKLSISQKNDENLLIPCTPYGCLLMLRELNIDLVGKNAVVIGRSNIVGKPMAQLLLKESCTVTIVHSKTVNIKNICRNADILVAAIGKPEFVNKDWVKEGAIVIDVGINRVQLNEDNYKLVGDVLYDEVEKRASAISPVPGGVGPMTIACLLRNTTISCKTKLSVNQK